ncbi:alpha/beta hydrolase [Streptobacillus moniliformis]|uniref:Alpha/beta hydrolase fold-3 domain protein n=2 Tax=Streptobacillus moniliformis TaxID=34105 RepID=D1AVQ8_STRM9|nr:alpha/beta hydrolase [Streptobacillus moniliformis]ACZ01818.1 Alpha/beta hydrolase fold-3 domain protein [Streptobacillus moniliformis DSM 12112]AVL43188.1 alpha/beta hydrolase [Streptobacillus moniliformis]SQA12984.1 Lipase 2 [Streptobacillus moniliformis]
MDIRKPKSEEYRPGHFSPEVKYINELRIKEAEKREIKTFSTRLEKLRDEMWAPNIDITSTYIRNDIEKIDGIRVVKYSKKTENMKKLIIYFHGGAYFGGSTDLVHNSCRYIAEQTDATVISVDYSLAPEFPYPKAINEGYTILKYFENKYEDIYLCGDSAGGGLACSVCIKDIEEGSKIAKGLILYYPVLLIDLNDNCRNDFTWDIKEYDIDKNNSEALNAIMYLKDIMPFIKEMYIKTNEPKDNYYISQINAPDSLLKQFPKTLIFTSEYDYLRLEAEYFHKRLKENGIKSVGIRYAGEVHGFITKVGYNDNIVNSVNEITEFIK